MAPALARKITPGSAIGTKANSFTRHRGRLLSAIGNGLRTLRKNAGLAQELQAKLEELAVPKEFNDLMDRRGDQQHPLKRRRPIASGKVAAHTALALIVVLASSGLVVMALVDPCWGAWGCFTSVSTQPITWESS